MEHEGNELKLGIQLTEALRITDLFSLNASQSADELKSALFVEDFPDVRKSVSRLVPWTSVQSAVAGSLQTALDVPVVDVFANAWKHYDTLRKDVKESLESPRSRVMSALADHKIDSTLHPTVDVLVGTARVSELVFDVTLTIVAKGLVLMLQNGAVSAIEWGNCRASGAISLHGIELVHRDLFELRLPGQLRLNKPIDLQDC